MESVRVTKGCLLLIAISVGDGVYGGSDFGNARKGIGDDLAILNIFPSNLHQLPSGGSVGGNPLRRDRDFLGSVNGQAGAVECLVAVPVWIEITAISITETVVRIAGGVLAAGLRLNEARVGDKCGRELVRFPNVHFLAAAAILPSPLIWVVRVGNPVEQVCLCRSNPVHMSADHSNTMGWEAQRTSPLINLTSFEQDAEQ